MASSKRITKVTEALNALNKEDIYSLMLFTLYKNERNSRLFNIDRIMLSFRW